MRTTTGGLLLLAALLATGSLEVSAQQGRGMRGGQAMRGADVVEGIMRMRDRLELTDEQLGPLDAIRAENVQRRTAEMVEMTEVQSRYAAGQIERSDVMAAMEGRRDAMRGTSDADRNRIEAILTEAQLENLGELRSRGRAFSNGRASGMSGRSGRSGFRNQRGGQNRGGFRGGRGSSGQNRGGFRGGRDGNRDQAFGNSRRGSGRWNSRSGNPGQRRRGPARGGPGPGGESGSAQ